MDALFVMQGLQFDWVRLNFHVPRKGFLQCGFEFVRCQAEESYKRQLTIDRTILSTVQTLSIDLTVALISKHI